MRNIGQNNDTVNGLHLQQTLPVLYLQCHFMLQIHKQNKKELLVENTRSKINNQDLFNTAWGGNLY